MSHATPTPGPKLGPDLDPNAPRGAARFLPSPLQVLIAALALGAELLVASALLPSPDGSRALDATAADATAKPVRPAAPARPPHAPAPGSTTPKSQATTATEIDLLLARDRERAPLALGQ